MSNVLRGQEGFPNERERAPAGPVDADAIPALLNSDDWEQPEQAEVAIAAVRDALAQRQEERLVEVDRTSESAREVEDMEQIETEVAPGRGDDEEQAPTKESAHD